MNPRIKRLHADYARIRAELPDNEFITIVPMGGAVPPDRYRVTFRLAGVRWDDDMNRSLPINDHVAEIYLHTGYPREKPKCVMITPIWHPNFGRDICIGDHWAAGASLVDIIVQIADMIQYKSYNTKSPLNKDAAKWVEKNRRMFPLGNVNIMQPRADVDISAKRPAKYPPVAPVDDLGIILQPVVKKDLEIELK